MGTVTAAEHASAEVLRATLVDELRERGSVRTPGVEAALRAVPRHLFVPGVALPAAYANDAVVTKSASDGSSLSLASQPGVVAMMLEQLDVAPGHRVLEIGAGTGYNAALLAHLAGPAGRVTTVDLDDDVADGARRNLASASYSQVRVVCGDGEFGAADDAPYDRLIATVAAWDLAPAWLAQLSRHGRVVVPLRLRGLTRSVALEWRDGQLRSRSVEPCGFVPMRGVGAYPVSVVRLGPDGSAELRIEDGAADAAQLRRAAGQSQGTAWTGVTVGVQESFCPLDLWLAGMDGFCRIAAQPAAVEGGLARPALPFGTSAVHGPGGFAYLTLRRVELPAGDVPSEPGRPRYELGAAGYGTGGGQLAAGLAGQVQAWDREQRLRAEPRIEAYPAGSPAQPPGRLVITRRHCRFAVVYG